MVEVEEKIDADGKPQLIISSPKYKGKFFIRKSNDGFAFFKVSLERGKTPKNLDGSYTTLRQALEDVKKYISTAPESKVVRRDRVYEENH